MKPLHHGILLFIIYAAFVSLGLPDAVWGASWPVMGPQWGLGLESAGIVTLVLTLAAACSGFASGRVLKVLGTGPVVLISGALTGGALVGFALAPSFWWLPVLALPLGFGAGSVDAGLNHFVAHHYSSRHMNWLHGFWGLGAALGPLIMGSSLAGGTWRDGYFVIACIQLTLAFVFLLTLTLWKKEPMKQEGTVKKVDPKMPVPKWASWLGPILFFFYVALEAGIGLWAASILVGDRAFAPPVAAFLAATFYAAIMSGRFLSGLISEAVGNRKMVRFGIILSLFGLGIFLLAGGSWIFCLIGLGLLGLGCAPVYPGLMHETPRRFDPETARKVVGRQVALASLGGALVPPVLGLGAGAIGLWIIVPVLGICALVFLILSETLNRNT